MLVDHGSQVFTCTDGCPTCAGPVFSLVLGSGREDVFAPLLPVSGVFLR